MSLADLLVTQVGLPLTGGKRMLSDADRIRRRAAHKAVRPSSFSPPRTLGSGVEITPGRAAGWPTYSVTPARGPAAVDVVFFHGGAYVEEITWPHWWFAATLARTVPARVTVPIYPLGALAGASGVVATATSLVAQRARRVGADRIVLAGDSAGGGLALAVAQALRDLSVQVRGLLLLAPWLDVTCGDPECRAIEPRDRMLAIPGLRAAGEIYAAGLPLDDPRVSPIHGAMHDLPPVTVFSGSDDLLSPDSHNLRRACARAGTPCDLRIGDGMQHDYPLFPTPEARAARGQIVSVLRTPAPAS